MHGALRSGLPVCHCYLNREPFLVYDWLGDDIWYRWPGFLRTRNAAVISILRAAVSMEHLTALRRALCPSSNPFHAAAWAVALVTGAVALAKLFCPAPPWLCLQYLLPCPSINPSDLPHPQRWYKLISQLPAFHISWAKTT